MMNKHIKKAVAAALAMVPLATGASAATCASSFGFHTVDQAYAATCADGSSDAFFATDPTIGGLSGWTLAAQSETGAGDGALTFTTTPVASTTSGSFSVSNPSDYEFLLVVQTYKAFGVYSVNSDLTDFDWSVEDPSDLSYASIWYTTAPVPLPAGGALLLTAIGAFAALRRRRARG